MTDAPFDQATPQEMYIGRMVMELMKENREVLISKHGIKAGDIRFTLNPLMRTENHVCLAKHASSFRTVYLCCVLHGALCAVGDLIRDSGMIEKKIGKIESVNLGMGGYQDAMIGFNFTLGSESEHWGVNTEWQGHWAIERSEHAKWTEEARIEALGKAFQYLGRLLHDAKKTNVNQLVGVPIEATFEGMVLKDWRILKEVI